MFSSAPSSSNTASKRERLLTYKKLHRRIHHIKDDIRRNRIKVILISLLIILILCAICYAFYLSFIESNVSTIHSTNSTNTTIIENKKKYHNLPDIEKLVPLTLQTYLKSKNRKHSKTKTMKIDNNWLDSLRNITITADNISDININSLVWDFGACGCTGWGIEIVTMLKLLSKHISNIKLITSYDCWCNGYSTETVETMNNLQSRTDFSNWEPIQIFISHKPPLRYPVFPYSGLINIEQRPQIIIARSMIEVHRISKYEAMRMTNNEYIDEVWVPSKFVKYVFIKSGVPSKRIKVIGIPINIEIYSKEKVLPLDELPSEIKESFKYLSIFKWEPRKGADILLKAFIKEFKAEDNVQLYLQTYSYSLNDYMSRNIDLLQMRLHDTIQDIIDNDSVLDAEYIWQYLYPKIIIMCDKKSMSEMASVYKSVDVYVQASHGEGFGLPVLEAMAMALPVIVTNWSGMRDLVINDTFGYLIEVNGLQYCKNEIGRSDFVEDKQKWANISVSSLMSHMRNVFQDYEQAVIVGGNGYQYVMEHFHPSVINEQIETRFKELIFLKQLSSQRTENLL